MNMAKRGTRVQSRKGLASAPAPLEPNQPPLSLGFIYVPALLVIVAASVTLAPLGARTAHRMPVQSLRRAFAIVLYCLSIYMFWHAVG